MRRSILIVLGLFAAWQFASFEEVSRADAVLPRTLEFNRDVRPILADKCFACHGPDKGKRKADLRLDVEEEAKAPRDGSPAIVAGKPEQSKLVEKITAKDPSDRMPPAKFGKPLTTREIETLRLWIAQGAKWQKHWSRIAPRRPELPKTALAGWARNPIDHFVLARLEEEKLKPSPEADRRTLIRRLSFDFLGLPPRPEEVDAFLADTAPDAYEKLVERLLSSEHFGERMATYWLDLVRFADTAGYHSDNHRDITPYRDYVIKAFNENKHFDRFTIEQLAGDLLPNATVEQRVASGYNRLLQTTEEGGAQAKEYLAKYSADRVRNTSVIWLGATMGCCECHDHKFDPFTTREFYSLAAFFADLKETAVGRQEQTPLLDPNGEAALKRLDTALAQAKAALAAAPVSEKDLAEWEQQIQARLADSEKAKKEKLPPPVLKALKVPADKRSQADKDVLANHYRSQAPQFASLRERVANLEKERQAKVGNTATSLVSTSVQPRMIRVLPRGNWLDDSGEIVAPNVPASLPPLKFEGKRATRLDLANWMVAPDNPLVARVFVNRLWKLVFGQGIVRTLDDFGAQGTWPSHPELLDWLAVEFRESGWDIKHMLRLMVTSATYRQTSQCNEQLRQHDPYNYLLCRQGRFRIDAEMVRDNALAVSGLLSRKIGGKSVKPYQPDGYWDYLNFPRRTYQKDTGDDQYRRGLYTYWQRTFLHPSLQAFDAPSREECTVERPRSNTPLQALVLLNDPTYVEAARVLAEETIQKAGAEPAARIQFIYRRALNRPTTAAELKLLDTLYQQHRKQYQADKPAAEKLLKVGDRPAAKDIDPVELAAWTSVARVVLNLHEAITRN
jgi:hypothetical protein